MAFLILGAKNLLSSFYHILILEDQVGDPNCLAQDRFLQTMLSCASCFMKIGVEHYAYDVGILKIFQYVFYVSIL